MKNLKYLFLMLTVFITGYFSYSQDFDMTDIFISPLNINTSHSEIGAIEFEDLIVYSSNNPDGKKSKKGGKVYGIFAISKNVSNVAEVSLTLFSKKIASKYDDGHVCIANAENKLYFTSTTGSMDKHTNKPQLAIYEAEKTKFGWANPTKSKFNVRKYSSAYVTVSTDGRYMVFSSNREGSKSEKFDLWMIKKNRKGKWGYIKNISSLNTIGDEVYPFFDNKGNLFFSSDREQSLGGLDIFIVKDFIKGRRIVKRLPEPINSQYDDYGASFYPSKKYGYFTSNRVRSEISEDNGGEEDIYKFTFDESLIPSRTAEFPKEKKEQTFEDIYTDEHKSEMMEERYIPPIKTSTTKKPHTKVYSNKLEFRIQFVAVKYPYTGGKDLVRRVTNFFSQYTLYDEVHNGYKKYMVGSWGSLAEAQRYLQQYKRNISKDAFVVEYLSGKRIRSIY